MIFLIQTIEFPVIQSSWTRLCSKTQTSKIIHPYIFESAKIRMKNFFGNLLRNTGNLLIIVVKFPKLIQNLKIKVRKENSLGSYRKYPFLKQKINFDIYIVYEKLRIQFFFSEIGHFR